MGSAHISAIVIAIPIHLIEKNRIRIRVIDHIRACSH